MTYDIVLGPVVRFSYNLVTVAYKIVAKNCRTIRRIPTTARSP